MTVSLHTACIFGGTGFIGRQIVREMAVRGYRIKVATRIPERAFDLKPCGVPGQVVPVACDYTDSSIARAVQGCDVVVNCVGILFEKGRKNRFQNLHAELPGRIGRAAAVAGVGRLVHLSALGVDRAGSKYAKTKQAGEESVRAAFPGVTILRPSVVFGVDDDFFNLFARLSVVLPVLPLIGGGKTKLQPVYVGDVADAVMAVLARNETAGRIYELGGPDVVTLRAVYETMFSYTHRPKALLNLPWCAAKIQGAVMGLMPRPLLTADQVETLKTDSIVTPGKPGLADLGIYPTAMAAILPTYLSRFCPGGRFGNKKMAS
jgi:uncharacterized protein YbjT (DUF2867 family)